jgi:hypothetical protein
MRFAVIENGKVVNVTVADAALEPNWVLSATAKIGDAYVNGAFESFDPTPDDEATAKKANEVRKERNALLSSTDWTQVADAPVDQAAWATYRQALRDVTTQQGFPWTVDWPEQP